MANHVTSTIKVRANEDGMKLWKELFVDKWEQLNVDELHRGDAHLAGFHEDAPPDDELTRDWMCENIGAKWAYAEEADDDYMRTVSAWSAVNDFAEYVAKKIAEVDPEVRVVMEYEDEMPNFIGVAHFDKDGLDDYSEIEWDEIDALCREYSEELRELWNEDDQEYTDEDAAREIVWEVQHEVVYEWQQEQQ